MRKLLLEILIGLAMFFTATTVHAGPKTLFEIECNFSEAVYRFKTNDYTEAEAEIFVIEHLGDDLVTLPKMFQDRVWNVIKKAYDVRYPTSLYSPESFSKAAYGCK